MDRRAFVLGLAATTCALASAQASEIELLFVTQPGCPYCKQWEARIGPIYPRSPAGRRAPLREVDRTDAMLGMLELAAPVIFTPTFILISDGKEVGRVTGFISDDFFWGQIDRLIARLPAQG
jgi:hypothetical protein